MGARAWPFGCLCPGPDGLGCGTRFAQTVLAPTSNSGPGRSLARRRPEVAPFDGALQMQKAKREGRIRCGPYDYKGAGSRIKSGMTEGEKRG